MKTIGDNRDNRIYYSNYIVRIIKVLKLEKS